MSLPKIMLLACGSYSPPTNMHFRMFEIARDYFNQMGTHSVVGGIVSPVHDSYGKQALVAAKHRGAMVKLALQTSDWVRLSDWEIQQEQWTRTRMTLQYHQNYLNSYLNDTNGTVNEIIPGWVPENIKAQNGNVQVKLLCGADLLESFATPGLWAPEDIEAIVGQHGIVVVSRSGTNPEQFIFNSDVLTKYRRNIHIVTNWVSNEISSTVVRKLMRRGQSVKYLIDDYVIEYIKKNSLFGINDSKYILTPNQNEITLLTPPTFNTTITTTPNNDNFGRNLKVQYDYEDMDETDSTSTQNFILSETIGRPKVFCCGDSLNVKSLLGGGVGGSSGSNRPGQAVQIITDSQGHHITTTINQESGHQQVGVLKTNAQSTCSNDNNHDTDEDGDGDETVGDDGVVEENDKFLKELNGIETNEHSVEKERHEMEINLKATMSDDEGIVGSGVIGCGMRKGNFGKLTLPSTSSRHNDIIKFVFTDHGIRVISDKEYVV